MTQEPENPTDETLNLTDIAAEMGLTLDEVETEPQDNPEQTETEPENEATADESEKSSADTDPSQEADGQEPESDEQSDDDDSDAAADETEETPSATQEKLLKRIDKITAKRREAEDRAEQLEAEMAELRARVEATPPITLAPTPDNPLADVETPEQLEQRVSIARKVRKWALANLEGGTVTNAQGEEVYHEPAKVREYLANADEVLTEHAPRRQQWLQQRASTLPEAQAAYPALFKAGSQEQGVLREVLKSYPALKAIPNLELIVGDAIVGQQMRFARQQQAGAKAAPAKKPVKPTPSAPSPAKGTKVPAKDIQTRDAAKSIFQRGANLKTDDIADFLEAAL